MAGLTDTSSTYLYFLRAIFIASISA
ncbi:MULTISPECIES: hypothetical protein [Pseudomonas syringae group]